MLQAAFGILGGPALHRQDQVPRGSPADLDDACPVDHAVAACAPEHPAALAAVSLGVLRGDVLGVDVDDILDRVFQPGVGIVAAEEAVPRIEVDSNSGAVDERFGSVKRGGRRRVLGVGLESDRDPPGLGGSGCLLQDVAHQHVMLLWPSP